ncbi:MAG: HAD family hydrolase [Rhodopirellula sp.]|nr:HAD family hydrolase [Rhodopirellula sp.]
MELNHLEEDYCRSTHKTGPARTLPDTRIEIFRQAGPRRPPEHVLLDFDGTLSLIREGWTEVMVPMMVEVLQEAGSDESPADLDRLARDFVAELTGKQTIYQMIRLAEEVRRRGGAPEEPAAYKQRYHDRLLQRIAGRRDALRSGAAAPAEMLVPNSIELLEELRDRGAALYLASGTDEHYVIEEVQLLGLERYFGRHVYGALDDYKCFSKAMVIQRILAENRVDGDVLLGFGDGYVEIQNVKAVGGMAIGVASDEAGRSGLPDHWKRDRLIGVGADVIVPDYRDHGPLLRYLWNEV